MLLLYLRQPQDGVIPSLEVTGREAEGMLRVMEGLTDCSIRGLSPVAER